MRSKGKYTYRAVEHRGEGAYLLFIDYRPVAAFPSKYVTHGQCYDKPTVTYPATEHHWPLAGTKL